MLEWFVTGYSEWRGVFFDLWTISHIIAGAFIAYVVLIQKWSQGTYFWYAFSIGVVWEVFERITTISRTEPYTNSLADIVVTLVGYTLALYAFQKIENKMHKRITLTALCVIYAAIWVYGVSEFATYG